MDKIEPVTEPIKLIEIKPGLWVTEKIIYFDRHRGLVQINESTNSVRI